MWGKKREQEQEQKSQMFVEQKILEIESIPSPKV
jgi:hypothetical protein